MSWKDRRVLVTGGAGFIGSHLVRRLIDLGSDVTVADNFSRGKMENIVPCLHEISVRRVDLANLEECVAVSKSMDYVFHLAASVGGIQYIKKENVQNLTPSVLMNANMLEAARSNDIDHSLFASSACVYRERGLDLNQFRENECFPANPSTTYGWAKILGEILCRAYYDDYHLKTSSVRIFNGYGEYEDMDPKWSHVIPSLIRKAILYPKEDFKIFGDGRQERAFLYVKDCVEGLIRIIDRIEDGSALNLGGTEVISISELAERIVGISGKAIEASYDPEGPQGTHRYCADLTHLKESLGWIPQTSLSQGLESTYRWAERKLNGEE